MVLAIEKSFGASRSQSSLAISLLVVSLALTSMLLGNLLDRTSIRKVMMTGALLGSAAFGLLSVAPGPHALMAIYALLLGPATAMLGIVPSMTLASRAVPDRLNGRALGFVNMPLLVMIVPLVMGPFVVHYGARSAYQLLAVLQLLVIPALFFIREKPLAGLHLQAGAGAPPVSSCTILGRFEFWILSIAVGLLAGAGTMKIAHLIPLLAEQGRSFGEANLLLAISGGTGLIGSLLFGSLADRIGGSRALIINAFVQATMWTVFLAPVGMSILIVDALLVGACGGGVQSAFGVVLSSLFGQRAFSRALGLSSLSTLPFVFGLTPLASLLYEKTGSYHLPMGLMVAGFLLAAALLWLLVGREHVAAGRSQPEAGPGC